MSNSTVSGKTCKLDTTEVAENAVPPGFDKLDTPEVAKSAVPPGFDKLDPPEVAKPAVPPGFDKLDTPQYSLILLLSNMPRRIADKPIIPLS